MSTLAWTFTSIVSYIPLELSIFGHGSCFGLAFTKTCQYACNDTNVSIGFHEVSLKTTQSMLQKKSHGLRSLAKDTMNGRGHALMTGFPIENIHED